MANEDQRHPQDADAQSLNAEIHNDDFQFVLKALLKAYQPILEQELSRTTHPEELKKDVESNPPSCADELSLAGRIFKEFWDEEVAIRCLPLAARERVVGSKLWAWCWRHILCCIIFGWLLCRGPRNFRAWVYYLRHFWMCIRQLLDHPVTHPPTAEQRADFRILVRALGEAYKPYLTDQLASLEDTEGLPEEALDGKLDCMEGQSEAAAVLDRFLTAETAPALLGKESFEAYHRNEFFWFCRCWCLCAIRFGCCLARARNSRDLLWCLRYYFRCLGRCFDPLVCNITAPTGCTEEQPDTTAGFLFVQVKGTAGGALFGYYTLDVWRGAIHYPGIVTYPGGTPTGTSPVFGGLLGTIDTTSLSDATYTVVLTVHSGAGAPQTCVWSTTFDLLKVAVYISRVAGLAATPNCFVETAELGSPALSVGGTIDMDGSAYIYECAGRKVERYEIRYARITAPGLEPPQPAQDAPTPPTWPAGNLVAPPLVYDPSKYWPWTRVGEMPANLINSWGTVHVGAPSPGGTDYPVLVPTSWDSRGATGNPGGGRYSLLLITRDTAGHVYYDLQLVWLDNWPVICQIVKFQKPGAVAGTWEDIPPCTDILISWGKLRIIGLAWDALIDKSAPWLPPTSPNDNFDHYALSYQKQFVGYAGAIPIAPTADHPSLAATRRVPDSLAFSPAPVAADADLLAEWDLTTLDAGASPTGTCGAALPVGQENKLYRHCACEYTLALGVQDKTVTQTVSDYYLHHPGVDLPIKIVNDL